MPPLRVIVVGGGIGGPAVALGLAQNGHNVTIYERATNTSEVGYAFRITANCDRCLKHLGIDVIEGGAVAATTARMMNADGKVVMEVNENPDPGKAKQGENVFSFRPQLHQQLVDAALAKGVNIKAGVKVSSVNVEETAVFLENGERVPGDLIIAADGVYSAIRNEVLQRSDLGPSPSTGHSAFRFMLLKSDAQEDDVLSSAIDDAFSMTSWAGHGKRILVYPVDYDRQLNITCTHPADLSDQATRGGNIEAAIAYNQKVPLDTVRSIYSEFEPRLIRLFELADPEGFRVWKLVDMDEISAWSRQNTVLLGDACHPILPFGFSGAAMAIEDAVTLKTLLPADLQPKDVPNRLKLYEEIRKPRISRVRDTSRLIGSKDDVSDIIVDYRRFLFEHDGVAYTEERLRKHLGGNI